MDYAKKAYNYAKDNGWTSEQVKNATRQQVANVCEVDLKTLENPSTFLAWNIKRQVIRRLEADEAAAVAETRRSKILAKIQKLAGEHNATAEFVKAGDTAEGPCIVIRKGE